MSVPKQLEESGINISDVIDSDDDGSIFEVLKLLHDEGELNEKEYEGFVYAFDVLKRTFNELSPSDIKKARIQELKNSINQSKLDFFMKGYSRILSSYPAVTAFALMGATSSALIAAPLILTPFIANKISYDEYTKGKKYSAERLVKNYLHKEGVGNKFVFHGKSFGRMDSYRRKIEAFKGSVLSRYEFDAENSNRLMKFLKLSVMAFGRKMFDLITASKNGMGINKKLREAEKVFKEFDFSTKDKKDIYEEVSDQIYNQYLSSNIEQYLKHLVKERLELEKKLIKIKGEKGDYSYYKDPLYRHTILKLRRNEKEIKKISVIRNIEYANDPETSVYYAGVSVMAERVIREIKRNDLRDNNKKDIYGSTKLLRKYPNELELEKRKAFLRIKSPSIMNAIGLDRSNNKHMLLFLKCSSVLMSGNRDLDDVKERISKIIDSSIKNVEKRTEIKLRYLDFAEDFVNSFEKIISKDFHFGDFRNKSRKEKKQKEKELAKQVDNLVEQAIEKQTEEIAKRIKYSNKNMSGMKGAI